jgi:hypothetical protein
MVRHLRPATALILATLLPLTGACTSTKKLDTDKAEKFIKSGLDKKYGGAAGQVSCPDREVKNGDIFECTTSLDGQKLRIKVTQTSNKGTIDVDEAQVVFDVSKLEDGIGQSLGDQLKTTVKVDCGSGHFIVKDPKQTFECNVTDAAGKASKVEVTVKDLDGNIAFKSV